MKIEKNELSIYDVESLHQDFLELFKQDKIVLDMENVSKLDMSVIQLFVSLQKSCIEQSKSFKLTNVSKDVEDILKSCSCDFLLGEEDE